jgi:DNA helicase-2/ATP-dependent DNA helicase PcrA
LRSTAHTRQAAGVLEAIIRYLAFPLSSTHLARAFAAWESRKSAPGEEPPEEKTAAQRQTAQLTKLLRRCRQPETYLYPRPDADWLAALPIEQELHQRLAAFRQDAQRWLQAAILPIDQLVLTLAQELFTEAADLALAYKLALLLRRHAAQHPDKRLPDLAEELALIARNQRRFLGFDDSDLGYEPKKGVVTISTMHKAKGLEWDRVYLVGVNNYNFPSVQPHDFYRGENWFIHGRLNLQAEAIAQLEKLYKKELDQYIAGEATEKARLDYSAERLRLLYVGITRAKKELIITWNTGRRSLEPKTQATPFIALSAWEKESGEIGN